VWLACVCVGALACLTSAQTLDERLDEEQFLRGLDDLRLPEVLEHYIASHPTNEPVRLGQFEIARQRMILNDPASSPDQRLSSIERIIQVRGELLAQQAHDGDATGDSLRVAAPRRAIWLADQAA